MVATIFTNKELKFLRELVRHQVEFMIVGLSAAALQGAPVVTQDVDLWFKNLNSKKLNSALKKLDVSLVPSLGLHPPVFIGNSAELFDIVLTVHGVKDMDKRVSSAKSKK